METKKVSSPKKYDPALMLRVDRIRQGLGPQPLAQLWSLDPELRNDTIAHPKLRRILSKKVFPGDKPEVERLEAAKARILKALKK